MDTEKPLTVSIPEAGRRLAGLGEDASYRAAAKGDIPWIRVGGRKRVPLRALEQMLDKCCAEPSKTA
jgi:hypothetical protein